MADNIQEGQDVSWRWGGGNAKGKVAEVVEEGTAEVTSNKGNTVKRNARDGDPAVKISRDRNDVVKLAHELNEVKEKDSQ
ncbi:Hypervirulence associated protein TUDOR domain-containing protein [Abortiporus biennis]